MKSFERPVKICQQLQGRERDVLSVSVNINSIVGVAGLTPGLRRQKKKRNQAEGATRGISCSHSWSSQGFTPPVLWNLPVCGRARSLSFKEDVGDVKVRCADGVQMMW